MRVSYTTTGRDFPPLTSVRPRLSERERQAARSVPSPALPAHCKPWLDGNTYGFLLRFPYRISLSVTGVEEAPPAVTVEPAQAADSHRNVLARFSPDHFSVLSGYCLRTEPGIGVYIASLPHGYHSDARLVHGIVETWWYPNPLFIVFGAPEPGKTVTFRYGEPLCVLLPVHCGGIELERMTPAEEARFSADNGAYHEYIERHPESIWFSADGQGFTRAYKTFSRRNRANGTPADAP